MEPARVVACKYEGRVGAGNGAAYQGVSIKMSRGSGGPYSSGSYKLSEQSNPIRHLEYVDVWTSQEQERVGRVRDSTRGLHLPNSSKTVPIFF